MIALIHLFIHLCQMMIFFSPWMQAGGVLCIFYWQSLMTQRSFSCFDQFKTLKPSLCSIHNLHINNTDKKVMSAMISELFNRLNLFLGYLNVERGYSLVKVLFQQAQFHYIAYLKLAQNMHIAMAKAQCLCNDIGRLLKVKLKQSKQYDLAAEF